MPPPASKRKKKNCVFQFYQYDEQTSTSECLLEGCSKKIKGEHATNLQQHIRSKHPKEYKMLQELNSNKENIENADSESISSMRKSDRWCNIEEQCVKLVTVHGRPFSLLDDEAFQNLIRMIPISNNSASVNSHNVKIMIAERAAELRTKLSNSFKNKMLCLKMDAATCADRSFLGINVQYIHDGRIQLRTLGVIELHKRHTAEFLQNVVLYTLRKFRIHVGQIYSVTTDNGANMIKMIRLLREMSRPTYQNISGDDDDDGDNEGETLEEWDESSQIEQLVFEEGKYTITSVRCAAHTLQLAVQDALKDGICEPIINEARQLVKKLRTASSRCKIRNENKRKPILDCATRWNSTQDMLERLLELKDCCSNMTGQYQLSASTWDAIVDIVRSLSPARKPTLFLQNEQLTFGDFYCAWIKCQLETVKANTPLALQLVQAMKVREKVLLSNDAFLNAVYLDPRVNVLLSKEQQEQAKTKLVAVWTHMTKLEKPPATSRVGTSGTIEERNVIVPVDEEEDDLDHILRNAYLERNAEVRQERDESIEELLKQFLNMPLLTSKENIVTYWEKKKMTYPKLQKLANVVLSVPATQVSVERLFSSLKFVLSCLRTNLREDIIQDILILRNNHLYQM